MSKLSRATTNVIGEASDSNSTSCNPSHNKRARRDSDIYISRFKGVVTLLNGHWGAQMYANHQRFWLGTFKSEKEAARAYDSAAIKIRNGQSDRNFPWTSITAQEPNFQSQFSTEVVLRMIKDGSYPSKFANYLKLQVQSKELEVGLNFVPSHWKGEILCTRLFEKELTPSDVSKLHRIVIPKKHASSYFPCILDGVEGHESGVAADDLIFYDRSMISWVFRYCYWKSSQSYVFTRGWNKFVQEKQLNSNDRIIFSLCEYTDARHHICRYFMIDVAYFNNKGLVEEISVDVGENVVFGEEDFELEEGVQNHLDNEHNSDDIEDEKNSKTKKDLVGIESADPWEKGFKLFGVKII